jgi:hypothetical protein
MPTDTELYAAAMISGHVNTCIAIEKRNDLYGYPPQLVSIGLRAIEEGRDPHEAIDAFIEDAEDEMGEGDD